MRAMGLVQAVKSASAVVAEILWREPNLFYLRPPTSDAIFFLLKFKKAVKNNYAM